MNTPTPWRIHEKTQLTVVAQNNRTVANTGAYNSNIDSEKVQNENVANAELIVRAVNYHDRLVDCLTKIIDSEFITGTSQYYRAKQLLTELKKESNAND